MQNSRITRWLTKHQNDYFFVIYASVAAFMVYFCMYAFRKPFAVAMFDGLTIWGLNYKIVLIISQVSGYALSKFIGIKVISEMKPSKRAILIVIFLLLAETALLLFGLVNPPYNFFFLFLNGIPLGMIWGLVFSYLEGRRTTEILAACLSVSYIFSTGTVKSIGKWTIVELGVSDFWMPFVTGAIFIVPLLISIWLLNQIPAPNDKDKNQRVERVPMTKKDRYTLFLSLAPGLLVLISFFFLLTAYRDFRDNFAVEIWSHLGYGEKIDVFAKSEIPVSIIVLALLGLFFLVKENVSAVRLMLVTMSFGIALLGISTFLFEQGIIKSPMLWMICIGTGLYIAYVPHGSMLFERIVALFRFKGNAGYLIYLADSFGYLGSVIVLLYKEFFFGDLSIYSFFLRFSYLIFFTGIGALLFSNAYFIAKYKRTLNKSEESIQELELAVRTEKN
jgi:hypothetical protein